MAKDENKKEESPYRKPVVRDRGKDVIDRRGRTKVIKRK